MRTRNGDAVFETHHFRQHQRAGNDGNLLRHRRRYFGIVFFHCSGSNHHVRTLNVFGRMAGVNLYAQRGQMTGYRALRLIRTRNGIALIVQHFGNTAHARTADADKMDVFDSVFHDGVPNNF